jgi:hypothetical protein
MEVEQQMDLLRMVVVELEDKKTEEEEMVVGGAL